MSMMNLWNTVNNIASIALGGTSQRKQFIMTCEGERLTLPVTPVEYNVRTKQLNKVIDVIDFGEALLFGNAGLYEMSFSCFFPRLYHEYSSIISGDYDRDAADLCALIDKWKRAKKPVRVIITDSPINHMFGIMAFEYEEKDGSRDIYYDMTLREYKDLNVPPANNEKQVNKTTGLKERPVENTPPVSTDKIKRGRDILEVSKKTYGTVSKWRAIAKSNNMTNLAVTSMAALKIGKV